MAIIESMGTEEYENNKGQKESSSNSYTPIVSAEQSNMRL